MKTGCKHLLLGLALVAVAAGSGWAQTRYVTDQLIITLREMPDDASPSIRTLRTDTAVELLEEGETYLKVRTNDGAEGYVKKQYFTEETPKTTIVAGLKIERDRLQQEVNALKGRVKELQSGNAAGTAELEQSLAEQTRQLAQSRKEAETASAELAALQKKFTTLEQSAGNVLQVVGEREKLLTDNERMTAELETLQGENAWLVRTTIAKWALTGAGILFVGWIMGKASRTRRRY
jgi:SH3 domain protein